MTSRYMVFGSAGLWLALVVISFVAFVSIGPTGNGTDRDMVRIIALLTWQGGAMVAAVTALLFMARERAPRGFGLSLAGIGPMVVMSVELILAVALFAWVATRDPAERLERFYYPDGSAAQTLR